jgi:hypothetical protein
MLWEQGRDGVEARGELGKAPRPCWLLPVVDKDRDKLRIHTDRAPTGDDGDVQQDPSKERATMRHQES